MSHKKEAAGFVLAFVVEIFQNQMVLDWGKALLYGCLGWIGAKLAELSWSWIVKKVKNGNA
jgi:hypothetical protein